MQFLAPSECFHARHLLSRVRESGRGSEAIESGATKSDDPAILAADKAAHTFKWSKGGFQGGRGWQVNGSTGAIEPTVRVDISSELSGTVKAVRADFNDAVKAGDTLLVLETDELRADILSAKAKLAAAAQRNVGLLTINGGQFSKQVGEHENAAKAVQAHACCCVGEGQAEYPCNWCRDGCAGTNGPKQRHRSSCCPARAQKRAPDEALGA